MTLLYSGLRAAAAAGPSVQPSSLQRRLPYRASTMSEFLLALLTLSGLLPTAKVLTVGASPGKETTFPLSSPSSAFLLEDACREVSVKLKSLRPRSSGPVGYCVWPPGGCGVRWGISEPGATIRGSPAVFPFWLLTGPDLVPRERLELTARFCPRISALQMLDKNSLS